MHSNVYTELEARFPDLDRRIGSWFAGSPWSVWSAFVFEIYGRNEAVDFDVGEPVSYFWIHIGPRIPAQDWVYSPENLPKHCIFVGDPWPCLYDADEEWCSLPECKGGRHCYTKSRELMVQAGCR